MKKQTAAKNGKHRWLDKDKSAFVSDMPAVELKAAAERGGEMTTMDLTLDDETLQIAKKLAKKTGCSLNDVLVKALEDVVEVMGGGLENRLVAKAAKRIGLTPERFREMAIYRMAELISSKDNDDGNWTELLFRDGQHFDSSCPHLSYARPGIRPSVTPRRKSKRL